MTVHDAIHGKKAAYRSASTIQRRPAQWELAGRFAFYMPLFQRFQHTDIAAIVPGAAQAAVKMFESECLIQRDRRT